MKEKMKKYQWLSLAIAALLIAGFAFYWFEWRPSEIRKECARITEDASVKGIEKIFADYIGEEGYKKCIRTRGLEK